jgi:hypothetical protein
MSPLQLARKRLTPVRPGIQALFGQFGLMVFVQREAHERLTVGKQSSVLKKLKRVGILRTV